MLDRPKPLHDDGVSVVLRPLASPSSLGLFGLAGATFTLSGLQLGWMPADQARQVALVLMAFGFGAQIIACVMAFAARDGVVATAMGVLSLTWLSVGLTLFISPPGSTSKALGLLLVITATALLLTAVTGARAKSLAAVVFFVASARFALTAVYQLSGRWKTAAGVAGMVLAAVSVGVAWVLELAERSEELVDEPGIRPKL